MTATGTKDDKMCKSLNKTEKKKRRKEGGMGIGGSGFAGDGRKISREATTALDGMEEKEAKGSDALAYIPAAIPCPFMVSNLMAGNW
jgi:hypothetical protein